MIITSKFVMINFPKTGSTFARQVLEELHQKMRARETLSDRIFYLLSVRKQSFFKSIMLPQTEFAGGKNAVSHQHGRWEQIPEPYKGKPVVSIVRNPLKRNISNYEYRWWADHPIPPLEVLMKEFPNFPNLSFEEYIKYQNFNIRYRLDGIELRADVGSQTIEFIQFFFKDPASIWPILDDDYIKSGNYREDMPSNITFLRTENLNEDLFGFLLQHDYHEEELAFILQKERLRPQNTDRSSDQERRNYLSAHVVDLVKRKERLLLNIYADHGVTYDIRP